MKLAAVAAGFLMARVGVGLRAWQVASRSSRLAEVVDRHGRRVAFRRTVQQPRRGDVLPVVCVPGLSVSSGYFVPLMRALHDFAPVYSPHPPGHAGSDRLREVSVARYADALLDWLDALALQRVSLVANSLGCQVALAVAARAPERVAHCVLIGPTADRAARSVVKQGVRLMRSIPFDQRSIDLITMRDYVTTSVTLGVQEIAAMLADRPEATAPFVRCPVLLLRGAHDHVAPRAWLDALVRWLPQARVHTISGAGHAAHYTQASEVGHQCRLFFELPERRVPLRAADGCQRD